MKDKLLARLKTRLQKMRQEFFLKAGLRTGSRLTLPALGFKSASGAGQKPGPAPAEDLRPPAPGAIYKTRNLRVVHTLQDPPNPMLILSPSTMTGTWRLPSVSRSISSMAWTSSLTSR